ncbi:hypothetical protein [Kineosporia sp. A_224]|uniref:hypothetical protein n=1 Tax=Kineosporia sp. A_224 TaxID=1962180 RepID=UPI000B4BD5E1|nr:hypothetical protein [Kineosporia sp. A_224]
MRNADLRARLTRAVHDRRHRRLLLSAVRAPGASPAGRRRTTAALAVAALVGSGMAAAGALAPPPAHDGGTKGLAKVGPIDPANGFPIWYKDTNGVRLELCTDPDDQFCIMGDLPNPGDPVVFPTNFPDEAFWSVGDSAIDLGNGNDALLVTAVEAAFGSADGLPAPKQQMSFGRVRTRIEGLTAGATYTVTHPYGVDTHVAEDAVRGVNVTEDVGNLVWDGVFDQTLASRPAPFLKWTDDAPAAPEGYLGDPAVPHKVTGSPYGTNVFRIEGPAGSFPASPDQCADIALGASDQTRDDCVETDLFTVQGKIATKIGAQITKASYTESGGDLYLDVFATSEPGQTLTVGGSGLVTTTMRGSSGGEYFARVKVGAGGVPAITLTNVSDTPDTTSSLNADQIGDSVHVSSAVYDATAQTLTVVAASGGPGANLSLVGQPGATLAVAGDNVHTFTVDALPAPPAEVVVRSDKGGLDTDDVLVVGGVNVPTAVDAVITALKTSLRLGEGVVVDSSASTGDVVTAEWKALKNSGNVDVSALLTGAGPTRTFTPTETGTFTVSLTLTGPGSGNSDTASITFQVTDPQVVPIARAGADRTLVEPLSTVTLDGGASTPAGATYLWAIDTVAPQGTPVPALTGATTATPSFVLPLAPDPAAPVTVVLSLVVADNGVASAPDGVTVTSAPDGLTLGSAQWRTSSNEWRVRGDSTYCGQKNLVTVYYNPPNGPQVELGSVVPVAAAGVCGWDFRLRNAPAGKRAVNGGDGTITVRSRLGGLLDRQVFSAR